MNADTLPTKFCLLGSSTVDATEVLSDQTWVEGSQRKEVLNPFPLTFSRKSGRRFCNFPRNWGGHGSKSSMGANWCFLTWPKTCFSNCRSAILALVSFLLQGTFHWHAYEVMGSGVLSSSGSDTVVASKGTWVMEAGACNSPETWVHDADSL